MYFCCERRSFRKNIWPGPPINVPKSGFPFTFQHLCGTQMKRGRLSGCRSLKESMEPKLAGKAGFPGVDRNNFPLVSGNWENQDPWRCLAFSRFLVFYIFPRSALGPTTIFQRRHNPLCLQGKSLGFKVF